MRPAKPRHAFAFATRPTQLRLIEAATLIISGLFLGALVIALTEGVFSAGS